jgi:hypothetical protein
VPPRFVEEGEVFGVAVGGGEEPEEDLGFDEGAAVASGVGAESERVENVGHAGAALVLVFLPARDAERLAEIFLRTACDPF